MVVPFYFKSFNFFQEQARGNEKHLTKLYNFLDKTIVKTEKGNLFTHRLVIHERQRFLSFFGLWADSFTIAALLPKKVFQLERFWFVFEVIT